MSNAERETWGVFLLEWARIIVSKPTHPNTAAGGRLRFHQSSIYSEPRLKNETRAAAESKMKRACNQVLSTSMHLEQHMVGASQVSRAPWALIHSCTTMEKSMLVGDASCFSCRDPPPQPKTFSCFYNHPLSFLQPSNLIPHWAACLCVCTFVTTLVWFGERHNTIEVNRSGLITKQKTQTDGRLRWFSGQTHLMEVTDGNYFLHCPASARPLSSSKHCGCVYRRCGSCTAQPHEPLIIHLMWNINTATTKEFHSLHHWKCSKLQWSSSMTLKLKVPAWCCVQVPAVSLKFT